MYGIENKSNFEMEVGALILRIRRHIDASTTYVDTYSSHPNKKIADDIAILKIHEFRMKEAQEWLDNMEINEWLKNREALQNEFQIANQLLLTG
jgi:hypothetical protein